MRICFYYYEILIYELHSVTIINSHSSAVITYLAYISTHKISLMQVVAFAVGLYFVYSWLGTPSHLFRDRIRWESRPSRTVIVLKWRLIGTKRRQYAKMQNLFWKIRQVFFLYLNFELSYDHFKIVNFFSMNVEFDMLCVSKMEKIHVGLTSF